MIVSASYRTDIPAFYGDWFRARLAAGFCRVANPHGGKPSEISLRPEDVDGFVFWTRNARPFRPVLEDLAARGIPFVIQYTVTGYPRALETSVIAPERALEDLRWIRDRFGARAAVWRYDPVILTSLTPPARHRAQFVRLAQALTRGPPRTVDEVVLSFATVYAKTKANTDRAANRRGFAWEDPAADAKRALLAELAGLAIERGLTPTLCSQTDLLSPGLAPSRCIDAERLSAVAQRPLAARAKGNRPGCLCAESRDIGAYDSCPHGCVYCYAVRCGDRAKERHRAHDPGDPFLIAPARPGGGAGRGR